jgi:IS30 family transposase
MTHINYIERQIIEEMLIRKKTHREIAIILKKDHTVISREINKNSKPYNADRAQLRYEKFLKGKKLKKLDQYPTLKEYVIEQIRKEWSPQEIEWRLKKFEHRKINGLTISHETIYQFIYDNNHRHMKLSQYLRTGRGKRRQWNGRSKRNKINIPDRISIHKRPEEINYRTTEGHWETDLMIFSNNKECLSVDVERKSRYCSINIVANKSSEEKLESIKKTIDDLPGYLFKSITYDNGTENVKHTELKNKYSIDTYFCDPYCSWQKGTVENTNKLLRQYFPRYINLQNITDEDIKIIQNKLNNRPRKCLGYLTPNEVLLGGAFNT